MKTILKVIIICLLIFVIFAIISKSVSDEARSISCIMLFLTAILNGYIEEKSLK